jgi:hypothetical protein
MNRGVAAWPGAVAVLVAACASTTAQDAMYPACNGEPSAGLATESTSSGLCPAHPTSLVGTGTLGASCTQASDCAPICCQCGNGQGAAVAQCANGGCLGGADTCCLYARQCAN